MSTLAYPVGSIVARLQALPSIRLLGIAPDLVAASAQAPSVSPALFVATTTSGGNETFIGPSVEQERTTRLHLILWVRNAGGAAAVVAARDALLAIIEARLAGFSPGDDFEAPLLESISDLALFADWLVTKLVYRCDWTFSAEVTP